MDLCRNKPVPNPVVAKIRDAQFALFVFHLNLTVFARNLIDNKSALVRVTHYMNQCWPSSPTFICFMKPQWVNTLRPRQNGRHFADDIFKCIFLNENVWISIRISLKFVPRGPIDNIPALVQIMAWRRVGDKPLFEPMMVSLLTHICVTRPQWVKSDQQALWHNNDTRVTPVCGLSLLSATTTNKQWRGDGFACTWCV